MANKQQEEQWRCADDEVRKNLPQGVKLVRTLRGHSGWIGRIAWSPDGKLLASPSEDKTIRLWDIEAGECLHKLEGHTEQIFSVAFDSIGSTLASGSSDRAVNLWEVTSGRLLHTLQGHMDSVTSVAFDPSGRQVISGSNDSTVKLWVVDSGRLFRAFEGHGSFLNSVAFDPTGRQIASGSNDCTIKLWEVASGRLVHTLEGHQEPVYSVAFHPTGRQIVSGSADKTIKVWETASGRLLRTLEGHMGDVRCVSFSANGQCLASKGGGGSIRLWRANSGDCLTIFSEPSSNNWPPGLIFHPHRPLLAAVGSDPGTNTDSVIHLYELDLDLLLGQKAEANVHYVNAKVVLVGDTGVGKSGLSLVLNRQPFEATESTPGRRVWMMDRKTVNTTNDVPQTRETLLWDLAGQPGYRVIHQLHLNEVAVALVVFDARSETDPLVGVRHWERALRLACQRQISGGVPMKKFLVSARNDRGGVAIGEDRLHAILKEFGFDGYFATSAKEGWQITELRMAIEQAIPWEVLPEVSSSQLFADIKAYLVQVKETGQILALPERLYADFVAMHGDTEQEAANRGRFETCIGRLEARDLIRRLTFGGYVLLQPELLDAYASAMVNTAKEEPDGLGSMAEEIALAGKFFVPSEQKVMDAGLEQLLLHATVEELVRHDLALRENADDGRYLVFPSQFNRDYEDVPEPKGKEVAITFDGPVQSLYATLVVRLGHSGLFTTRRAEMWRNAVMFTATAGGKCGLFVNEFSEGRGRLILFYDKDASQETRFHFEEYVLSHTARRSLEDSVSLVRYFVCHDCGEPVPDAYVKTLRGKGKVKFDCPCGGEVSLAEPKERIRFKSAVEEMDKSADQQRDFDTFVVSAQGETRTPSFTAWAGGDQVTLAIVFTDVVGSTKLGNKIGDSEMNEARRVYFEQSRKLIEKFMGRAIKTVGDSFMAVFHTVANALSYAIALSNDPGHPLLRIRAGIHIGAIHVEENDVFGGTVNFAARLLAAVKEDGIVLSESAKHGVTIHCSEALIPGHQWECEDGVNFKGFPGVFRIWKLVSPSGSAVQSASSTTER